MYINIFRYKFLPYRNKLLAVCYRGSLHATVESVLYERVAQTSAVATRS